MVKYHEIPEEEQIRTYPEIVKFRTQVGRELDQYAQYYKEYQKNAKPAMLINSVNKGYVSVIDVDYFKSTETNSTFPYNNIGEIMRDKTKSSDEKIVLCEEYLKLKMDYSLTEEAVKTEKVEDIEFSLADVESLDDDDFNMDDDDNQNTLETPINIEIIRKASMDVDDFSMDDDDDDEIDTETTFDIIKTMRTPREMFDMLCAKFPKRFMNADSGKGRRIGWLRVKEGRTYTPTLITINPVEEVEYVKSVRYDSTIRYIPDSYYIKELETRVYFVRTTKE